MGHSDIELNAAGYSQVERLRDRLANEKIDAVYSSDLKRTLVTAEVISSRHKMDIVTCPELREVNYGAAEGLTFEEIGHHHPELAKSITNFSLELSFPDGESFKEFIARTCQFFDRLNEHAQEQTILIVSHGGALRTLVCDLLGIDQSHWRKFRFDNASLSIVETHPRGAIINLLNDTSHIKEVG
jgi:alpha-ribazole phosphatase